MDPGRTGPRVFLFPWLAYGHISPFLGLAKKLSERGSCTYLCSTPVNLKSVEKKLNQFDASLPIQFVELHLPSLPELPPTKHTTNGLSHHLIPTLMKALKMSRPTLSSSITSLSPDLIIYDHIFDWMPSVASSLETPAIPFSIGSAAFSYFWHASQHPQGGSPFHDIHLSDFEKASLERLVGILRDQRDPEDEPPSGFSSIMLIKTSREVEGRYLDYHLKLGNNIPSLIPVGLLIEDPIWEQDSDGSIELIQWLGKQKQYSTVLLSFGSEYYLQKEDIEEIAYGLELSQVNFIWALRFPEGESLTFEKALPEGFLPRIGDKGRVVRWVPQSRILSHPNIGGFVSHCGWGSVSESLEYSVPLIALPQHLDQPLNAKSMVEMGVAAEVTRGDNGEHGREEIAKVIKNVIFGNTGQAMREKAREVRQKVKMKEKEEMDRAYHQLLALINPAQIYNS